MTVVCRGSCRTAPLRVPKSTSSTRGELSASNPAWKKIYADWAPFRRDQHLMFRFAEAGFDDFMQQQKL